MLHFTANPFAILIYQKTILISSFLSRLP